MKSGILCDEVPIDGVAVGSVLPPAKANEKTQSQNAKKRCEVKNCTGAKGE
jgi:hypothetical protein